MRFVSKIERAAQKHSFRQDIVKPLAVRACCTPDFSSAESPFSIQLAAMSNVFFTHKSRVFRETRTYWKHESVVFVLFLYRVSYKGDEQKKMFHDLAVSNNWLWNMLDLIIVYDDQFRCTMPNCQAVSLVWMLVGSVFVEHQCDNAQVGISRRCSQIEEEAWRQIVLAGMIECAIILWINTHCLICKPSGL